MSLMPEQIAREREAFDKWFREHYDIPLIRNSRAEAAWLARAERAAAEREQLVTFARWCISELQLDVEGVQDKAVECGLLAPHEVTEPCREHTCACAECGFPQTCYRMTSILAPREKGATK